MVFDGKTRQISHGQGNRKTFSVHLSNGGQTITINSIVYFITGTPYKVNVKQPAYTDVTEVWNLSNDGKSIAVLAKAKSNIWREERSWKTVFDRID
jgi:glycerate kinase